MLWCSEVSKVSHAHEYEHASSFECWAWHEWYLCLNALMFCLDVEYSWLNAMTHTIVLSMMLPCDILVALG